MSVLLDLLSLQKTDTAMSQARHRLAHLPQIETHQQALASLNTVRNQIEVAARRHVQALADITQLEAESHQLDVDLERLHNQLRSIVAIREFEALQHEIVNLQTIRSSLDDKELDLLELVDALASEMESNGKREQIETTNVAGLHEELEAAQQVVRVEIQELSERRSAISLVVPERNLLDYESKRKHISGGAVAELRGPTCQSCHLDISKGELDAMKKLPADEFPECPNCGCYLVI
ncbi:MAG: hypothetical protein ABI570_06630 [Ilumatobacteraceae bacterium]